MKIRVVISVSAVDAKWLASQEIINLSFMFCVLQHLTKMHCRTILFLFMLMLLLCYSIKMYSENHNNSCSLFLNSQNLLQVKTAFYFCFSENFSLLFLKIWPVKIFAKNILIKNMSKFFFFAQRKYKITILLSILIFFFQLSEDINIIWARPF